MSMLTNSEAITLMINYSLLPRYLYKYRNINARLDEIITNGNLWFSTAKDFNDPFDCQITINTQNTHEEIKAFLEKHTSSSLTSEQINNLASNLCENPRELHQKTNQIINEGVNEKGLCCFCEKCDNILLWSHYTESHKGVCLKFDVLQDPDFFVYPIKIKYQNNYPTYNHLQNHDKIIELLIGTKSEVWKYEQEIRVIKPEIGNSTFKKSALVEIIFGCNCEEKQIIRIKNLLIENEYPNVTFYKAIKKTNEFGIEFLKI